MKNQVPILKGRSDPFLAGTGPPAGARKWEIQWLPPRLSGQPSAPPMTERIARMTTNDNQIGTSGAAATR